MKTSPNSCVTSQTKINTKCLFSCLQGYQLQGPAYKQCGANGQWTNSAKAVSCTGELYGNLVAFNVIATKLFFFEQYRGNIQNFTFVLEKR